MKTIRKANTKPELVVRRLVYGMGYRYRLHRRDLPGSPDLVFSGRRKVIFVHGCFWHRHACRLGAKQPKKNLEYWLPKLERNRTRDRASQAQLREMGWRFLVIWECELKDLNSIAERVVAFLESRPQPRPHRGHVD